MPTKIKKALFFLVIVSADQSLKYLARKNLLPEWGEGFQNVCNPMLAWGVPVQGFWFWFLWLIAFSGLLFLVKKYNYNLFLIMAISGAVSNFIDRIIYGCVIDFIKISSFPVFNLADICITVGIILFLIEYIKKTSLRNTTV